MKIGGTQKSEKPVVEAAQKAVGEASLPSEVLSKLSGEDLTPAMQMVLGELLAEIEQLRRDTEETRARLRTAEELADRDPLLPLLNRRAFMREIARVVAFARRYGEPAGLAYFDIDNFKQINDAYGHAVGDAALVHLSGVLAANIRESDVLGRLGGDEFAIILSHADEAATHAKARSLELLISLHPLMFGGMEIPLSISVGATVISPDDEPETLLSRADQAMYRVKQAGAAGKTSKYNRGLLNPGSRNDIGKKDVVDFSNKVS